MKNFRCAIRTNRCRCLQSPLFCLSIFLLWDVWFADQFQDLLLPAKNIPVLFSFRWRQSSLLLAAVPFAMSFCKASRNRFLWYSVQRANIRAYGPCASEFSARHALAIFQGRNSKVILERAYKICRLSNCMTKHKRRMFMYNE